MLDPDKIATGLKTKRVGRKTLVYDSTSSTNDVAAEYAKNAAHDGWAVFAEQQTVGRGRAGNQWHSGRADSILCSIVLTRNELPVELLSLACAVAVAEAVGKPARIKWPNDIMLNGKKVAGILLETKPDGVCIVGVGINCHQSADSFAPELQSVATSIDIETNSVTDRTSLARRLLTSLDHWLDLVADSDEKAIDEWCSLSIQLGHRVKLIYNGRQFAGNCIGVDPEKGLILQLDSGGIRMFDAAHTSIAK
ncbi:MAG: biotin--[acetyl-CoA-carboxylase] ligase [Planctomycetota bacterium]|jgi:BirA family biotin operon repressor/biotin-[acetyl-CoA-carboxylase] ligase